MKPWNACLRRMLGHVKYRNIEAEDEGLMLTA